MNYPKILLIGCITLNIIHPQYIPHRKHLKKKSPLIYIPKGKKETYQLPECHTCKIKKTEQKKENSL